MNFDEVRKYRSVERRMVDSRVRFISPSQVEGRCGDTNAGKCGQRPLLVLKFVFPEPCPKCAFSEEAGVLRNSCVNHVVFSKRFLQSGPNLK